MMLALTQVRERGEPGWGVVRDLKVAPGGPWTPQGFAKARLTVPAPWCPLSAGPGSGGLLTTCSNPKGRKRRGWGWFGKCHQLVSLEREGVQKEPWQVGLLGTWRGSVSGSWGSVLGIAPARGPSGL